MTDLSELPSHLEAVFDCTSLRLRLVTIKLISPTRDEPIFILGDGKEIGLAELNQHLREIQKAGGEALFDFEVHTGREPNHPMPMLPPEWRPFMRLDGDDIVSQHEDDLGYGRR